MKLHAALAGLSAAMTLAGCVRESVEAPVLGPIETQQVGEIDHWQAGTHYVLVQPSSATPASAGKVTVVEFFWYGSPQCYTLDPHLVLWSRRKPDNIELQRVPTTWGQYDRPHARLFYALELLGRNELHAVIFDTIHGQGKRLASMDEQMQFAKKHGIEERAFRDAYDAPVVLERLSIAEQALAHYEIDKLPTLVVNGRYKTDVTRVGRSSELLMRLISDLAVNEAGVAGQK